MLWVGVFAVCGGGLQGVVLALAPLVLCRLETISASMSRISSCWVLVLLAVLALTLGVGGWGGADGRGVGRAGSRASVAGSFCWAQKPSVRMPERKRACLHLGSPEPK